MRRLFLIVLFLEVGFVLMVVPWSAYWDRNYFAEAWPLLHALITNNFVRGAVSGVGVVNLVAGVAELFSIFTARRSEDAIVSIVHSSAAED